MRLTTDNGVQDFLDRHWESIASDIEFRAILAECKVLARPYLNVYVDESDIDQINERRFQRLPNSAPIRQPMDRHTDDWAL
jgi:hypothetical protein